LLKEIEELSYEDIADTLEISMGTVKSDSQGAGRAAKNNAKIQGTKSIVDRLTI
jgi:DNA-directed RNA polymerase specialized sigma24 family protein